MMGRKDSSCAPLGNVPLEELSWYFYRHLERSLDLSIVREFVQETMPARGVHPLSRYKRYKGDERRVIFSEGYRG